ncbi:MAG: cupin domain-containing protein [Methanomicrobium sp.]|nr:cupin domain-containing protein [Methanomicrobium sp.]
MLIRNIKDMNYFRAGDNCLLCELFHPKNFQSKDILLDYSIVHAIVPFGEKSVPHRLNKSSEVYYILSGEGLMHINSETNLLTSGCLVYIPPGSVQYIENMGESDLVFLAIVNPPWEESDEEVIRHLR